MNDKKLIKWTLILLDFLKIFNIFVLGLIAVLILAQPTKSSLALFLLAAGFLGYIFICAYTARGLRSKNQKAWNVAIVVAAISLPSLLLPLAIMSLRELFNADSKAQYFSPPTSSDDITAPVFYPPPPKNHAALALAVFAVAIVGLFVLGSRLPKYFGSFVDTSNLTTKELYQKGADCNTSGNTDCSIKVFEKLVELNPSDLEAIANLGMAQTQGGQHREAVESFRSFFDKGGSAIDVMASYALSLNALGKKDQALMWYAKALSEQPNLIDVVQSMISILSEQGRYEDAYALVENFIQKNPSAERSLARQRETLIEKMKVKESNSI